MTAPVANARMYSATASVQADWRRLLTAALQRAGLGWDVIDYAAPAPLNALWARDDLGLAMMCGLPFSMRDPRPTLVAAPVPSPSRYGGRPVYFTDIVVRADSRHRRLEDTFGGTLGYTLADSMSGGVALHHHLMPHRTERGSRLYRQAVGGLVNARGVIEALAAGRIDVGPLDSYYHDLLCRNDPAFAAQVRTIDTTVAMPIPPLVATTALAPDELDRLRAALGDTLTSDDMAATSERLLLAGFATPDPADYAVLAQRANGATLPFEEL